jgi:hypothetical protein
MKATKSSQIARNYSSRNRDLMPKHLDSYTRFIVKTFHCDIYLLKKEET